MSISEKGQVVIPKELRDKYGIGTNDEVMVTEVGGHIAVLPAPKDPITALRGSVKFAQPVSDIIRDLRNEERQREEKLTRRFVPDHANKTSKKKQKR
jgi:AbrB family looped-hinge helix DNA binding protein